MHNETRVAKEKLKGNFFTYLSLKQSKPKRITNLANDPIAFHLHKQRHFFKRVEGAYSLKEEKIIKTNEIIKNIREEIKRINDDNAKKRIQSKSNSKERLESKTPETKKLQDKVDYIVEELPEIVDIRKKYKPFQEKL